MNAFEFNKIAGGILAVLLVIFGMRMISGAIFHQGAPEKPGYEVEVAADQSDHSSQDAVVASSDEGSLATRLAEGNLEQGQKVAKKCKLCHSFEKGGKHKVGPNLYEIVGADVASIEGFSYSGALKSMGGTWSFEALECFIKKPSACVPGTKMTFAGIKKANKLASLLLYLRSLSDAPADLP